MWHVWRPDDRWHAELDAALGIPSSSRHTLVVDAHTLLLDGDHILLVRRANTGFSDGMWNPPCGRLRPWESPPHRAVSEAEEQLRVRIALEDLEFAHVTHHRGAGERIGFFFATRRWSGAPVNAEPHKHDALEWFPIDRLPADTVAYSMAGIQHYRQRQPFSLHNWCEA